jgi:Ca2+-binding RTX toxin-like protein
VQSSVTHALAAEVENLTLTGAAAINGTGNALNNTIIGNAASNVLDGGAGADAMTGGAGNDTLTGGGGADWFIYTGTNNGTDLITDFSGGTDFGGGAGEGDLFTFESVLQGTFEYRGSDPFSVTGNTEARVSGSNVLVDTDGNGFTDITISVNGLTSASQLTASDFQFT